MKVVIPSALRSYTGGEGEVEVAGATVGAVLDALEARHPGFRFRVVDEQGKIRAHIRVTVNLELVDDLSAPLKPGDGVALIMAFSGG
ncbi:MAG TPA: MoaD/ThiS family protein [Elusimicrobiota bacterium]|nr:MoaD/ThiS family protein [Elusimicrobiota bacterium]